MRISIADLLVIVDTLSGSLSIVDNSSSPFRWKKSSREECLNRLLTIVNGLGIQVAIDGEKV